jgi:hypothetical protein
MSRWKARDATRADDMRGIRSRKQDTQRSAVRSINMPTEAHHMNVIFFRTCATIGALGLLAACTDTPTTITPSPSGMSPAGPSFSFDIPANGLGQCMGDDGASAKALDSKWVDGNLGVPPNYNCTANDISVASATITGYSFIGADGPFTTLAPGDRITCTPGQTVHVQTVAKLSTNATQRYDIGVWIAEPVEASAVNGACRHFNLLPGVQGSNDVDSDNCGDMASAAGLATIDLGVLEVICPAGHPVVTVNNCVAWANSDLTSSRGNCPATKIPTGTGTTVTEAQGFRFGTVPENSAKCNCSPFSLPIDVRGKITIVKNTVGGDGTFTFSSDVGNNSNPVVTSPFTITTSAGTNSQIIDNVVAGTYHIAEQTPPSDFTFTSLSCVGTTGGTATTSAATATIVLPAGGQMTCTYTNTKKSSLTLIKRVVNDNGGTKTVSDFGITTNACTPSFDGGAADGANTLKYTSTACPVVAGTYTLHEDLVTNYTEGTWACVGNAGAVVASAQTGSVVIATGETVTCTITNNDAGPSLTLNKVTTYTHGGTRPESDWTLTATGALASPSNLSGPGAAGSTDVVSGAGFKADTYTLGETGSYTGYTNGASYSCVKNGAAPVLGNSIALGIGDVAVCTITNTDVAPSLTLNKITSYTHGGSRPESNWTLTANGAAAGTLSGPGAAGSADVVSTASFKAGTYALTETGTFTGYTNGTNYSCVKNGAAPVSGNSITLAVGDVAVCSITNTDAAASLTLNKITSYTHGGTRPESDWTLTATGTVASPTNLSGPGAAGNADVVSNSSFKADTYTLGETGTFTGYTNGTNYSCVKNGAAPVSGNSITLAVGDVAVCSITNTDVAPSLTLNKITSYTHGGTALESAWTLTANGGAAGLLSGPGAAGSADVVSTASFKAGTYALSESAAPAGYQNGTSYSCVKNGGAPVSGSSITLAVGDVGVCSITNTDLPAKLTIVKIVKGAGGTFGFNTTGSGLDATFNLAPLADGSASKSYTTLSAGTYTIDEPSSSGYVLTDLGCSDQAAGTYDPALVTKVSVTLPLGGDVTCTFINEQRAGQTTRTQGFWAAHSSITNVAWFGGSIGGNSFAGVTDKTFCSPVTKDLNTLNRVLGGFWSGISQTSTSKKRSSIDQARMQLMQQLLAAILNNSAFGSSPSTVTIAQAKAAYCGTNETAIKNAASAMAAFNQSGDNGTFTPGVSANGKLAKTIAAALNGIQYWDTLP